MSVTFFETVKTENKVNDGWMDTRLGKRMCRNMIKQLEQTVDRI